MSKLITWLAMGGYSIYIWPAYGLVCLVLILNVLGINIQQLRTKKKLHQWFKR